MFLEYSCCVTKMRERCVLKGISDEWTLLGGIGRRIGREAL